jgi:hypothetical protein
MKKLIAIVFAVSLIAPLPAQANEDIINKMVSRYLSHPACSPNTDNLLLEVFGWQGGDSGYEDCSEKIYGDPISWAIPVVKFTDKDYQIWLKKCEENFFTYSCPQSKNKMNFDLKSHMASLYGMYKEAQKSLDGIETHYSESMESWNEIYKKYYPSQKHNCKPLKPFYYTSKTGRYIASAKQIDKNTVIVTAGPEYKTYKYVYTKKEQKEHMDSCIAEWKSDYEWYTEMYTKYKNMYIDTFNRSKYALGRECNKLNQIIEFKDIATVKCIKGSWIKIK